MRYKPQIKINNSNIFYTSGKQYMNIRGIEYIGYYHILNEKIFSGKIHDDNSFILINYSNNTNYINYINLKSSINNYKIPIPTIPIIDYSKDIIQRYFIKKRNDLNAKIIEIDSKQYKSLLEKNNGINENYYYGIEINWKVLGYLYDVINSKGLIIQEGVYDHNKREVDKYEPILNGITLYLSNLTEFAKITK